MNKLLALEALVDEAAIQAEAALAAAKEAGYE